MPSEKESRLEISFDALLTTARAIKSWQIESAYTTSTDGWSATIFDTDREALRGLELQPVELTLDGKHQLLGRVDMTSIGGNGHALELSGRDYISELVECNVDPAVKLKEQMTLEDMVKLVASPVGITKVVSQDEIPMRNIKTGRAVSGSAPKDFKKIKLDEFKPEPGTGIYQFLNKMLARHGATLQPTNQRDTVSLEAPDYDQTPIYKIHRTADPVGSARNNIVTSKARRDYSHFPTVSLFTAKQSRGSKSASSLHKQFDIAAVAENFGRETRRALELAYQQTGEAARRKPGQAPPLPTNELYRLLYFRDETSKNPEQLERAARREIAERLKATLSYSVTLRGHQDPGSGALWAVNTMVEVEDTICDVNEPLWIASRTFSYSEQGGATTQLECWRPETYQL